MDMRSRIIAVLGEAKRSLPQNEIELHLGTNDLSTPLQELEVHGYVESRRGQLQQREYKLTPTGELIYDENRMYTD